MNAKKRLSLSLAVVLLIAVIGFLFRYDIHDWIKLRGYVPSAEVVALADDTGMLAYSRRVFYVNRPEIAEKDVFNSRCRNNEHSIVLGCYMPGQQGIFLLNVTDERLSGIKEVTAAHEMLHATYERLGANERKRVDELVQAAYDNVTDTRVLETIELYRKQDPSIVPNEMHSILGTEVRVLPQELEAYYRKYFTDRSKVVRLAEQYEQAFTERKNSVRRLDAELEVLKADIETASKEISAEDDRLKTMRTQMNTYRSSGQNDAYNEMVPAYNQQVGQFNADIDELSDWIVRYNALVQKRNDAASEQAELIQAIDSRELLPNSR